MAAEEGFFSRWSRRKAESRPPATPNQTAQAAPTPPGPVDAGSAWAEGPVASAKAAAEGGVKPVTEAAAKAVTELAPRAAAHAAPKGGTEAAAEASPAADLPTLADVAALTPDADFSRFVARGVSAQVRNAALKKLFADPRFNVMDGLDIYIDDYSVPNPIEPEVVAQMLSSPFLDHTRLASLSSQATQEPEPAHPSAQPATGSSTHPAADPTADPMADPITHPAAESPAPAVSAPEPTAAGGEPTAVSPAPNPDPTPHDHADLLLQPDPAARPESPGPGAE